MDIDLDAIKRRTRLASSAPWGNQTTGLGTVGGVGYWIARDVSTSDREFIVHAREDVPALVKEVESLRAKLTAIGALEPEVMDTWGVVRFTSEQTDLIGELTAEFRPDEQPVRHPSHKWGSVAEDVVYSYHCEACQICACHSPELAAAECPGEVVPDYSPPQRRTVTARKFL